MTAIAFIGDSNTNTRVSVGIYSSDTFASKVAAARGFSSFVNAGVGGNNSSQMLARFNSDVIATGSECVNIMAGINDVAEVVAGNIALTAAIALYKSNLTAMVQDAKTAGMRVTLMTPNLVCSSDYINAFPGFNVAVKEVGYSEGVPVVDVYNEIIEYFFRVSRPTFDLLYVDAQHVSAAGHTFIKNLVCASYNASACV